MRLNQALHGDDHNFGGRADAGGVAGRLPEAIQKLHKHGLCGSLLDYGTGKGHLVHRLRQTLPASIHVNGYDPAVAAWCERPTQPADILTCLDVLEHVELAAIDSVLRDIKSLTGRFCYLVVDLQPAVKRLADGRNAHILLAPPEWWVSRIAQLFACQTSFPIFHQRGLMQKVVIVAGDDPALMPAMHSFLGALRIFSMVMVGGSLALSTQ